MLALRKLLPMEEGKAPDEVEELLRIPEYTSRTEPTLLAAVRTENTPLTNTLDLDELWRARGRLDDFTAAIDSHLAALEPVGVSLRRFNDDLGLLSTSLRELQQQLTNLSQALGEAKLTVAALTPVVLDLLLPPDTIRALLEDPVDGKWVEVIRVLNEKQEVIELVESGANGQYKEYKAYQQLKQGVALAKAKAVERIRDFLIAQIKQLRSAGALLQAVQEALLETKEAFWFMRSEHRKLADQLFDAYTKTMRWYYRTRFAKYGYALQKMGIRHAGPLVLLGAEASAGFFSRNSWFSQAPETTKEMLVGEYLVLAEGRQQILDDTKRQAVPLQIAETLPFTYWLEFVFFQWQLALEDNLRVEYAFVVEYFLQGDEKVASDGHTWWDTVFGDVFGLSLDFAQWLVTHTPSSLSKNANSTAGRMALSIYAGSCDLLGILLVIRLVQQGQKRLKTQGIPAADGHYTSLLMLLWPHFTKVVDQNCEALKRAMQALGSLAAKGAPLPVTQQYAQLAAAFYVILEGVAIEAEPLYSLLQRLGHDFEHWLTRAATQAFPKKGAEKEVFLYNNCFVVALVLANDGGSAAAEATKHFETLAEAYKK